MKYERKIKIQDSWHIATVITEKNEEGDEIVLASTISPERFMQGGKEFEIEKRLFLPTETVNWKYWRKRNPGFRQMKEVKADPVKIATQIIQKNEMWDFLQEVAIFNPRTATGAICIFCNEETPYLQMSYVGLSKKDIITALEKVKNDVLEGRIE